MTRKIKLTRVPQQISPANSNVYMQSHYNMFHFAFSQTQPTDLSAFHSDNKVFTDGSLGPIWAWLPYDDEMYVSVSP